jgi:hypothetical protein
MEYLRWLAGVAPSNEAAQKAQKVIREYLATIDKGIA